MPPGKPGSRELFPELQAPVYANHAAISPLSEPVCRRISATLAGYAAQGMGWYATERERRGGLRESLAGLVGAEPGSVGLVPNTSCGVMAIALGLPWQRGDRVVLFNGEFPTNVTPWQQAARREGLELAWLEAEDFRLDRDRALERLEQTLKQGVRLVAVSAVQFSTGQRMPLEAMGQLCRRHGAELFVDAIQAAGVVPLDVQAMGINYLATGSHKWLMAPEGLAALYVSPNRAGNLLPNAAGWLSHEGPFDFLTEGPGHLRYNKPFQPGARMAEAGTPNALAAAGLEASLEILREIGIEAILAHVQAWHDAAEAGLIARGFESARMPGADGRSGILAVRPENPQQTPAWVEALGARGIACAGPDGWIRISPHWPNGLDEPATLLEAVDAVLEEGLTGSA